MYDYENELADAPAEGSSCAGRGRVLVVGHTLGGCLLAELLGERGFDATIVPADGGSLWWTDERVAVTVRRSSLTSLDSNLLAVRATFASSGAAYYDLAIVTTGDLPLLEEQDRRRVVAVPPVSRGPVVETVVTLAALVALVDALAGTESVPAALDRYRRWRERCWPKLTPSRPPNCEQ